METSLCLRLFHGFIHTTLNPLIHSNSASSPLSHSPLLRAEGASGGLRSYLAEQRLPRKRRRGSEYRQRVASHSRRTGGSHGFRHGVILKQRSTSSTTTVHDKRRWKRRRRNIDSASNAHSSNSKTKQFRCV